ncbi:MAG TPA: hypothetical protein VIH35_08965, partial [Kiritimatiellia bacterium]
MPSNPGLTGSGSAPSGWQNWNDANHDAENASYLGTNGNAWAFWNDGGLYQDVTNGFAAGDTVQYGGYLYMPNWDPLCCGTKHGQIELEFYNSGGSLIATNVPTNVINQFSKRDYWYKTTNTTNVPAGTAKIRLLIRSNDGGSGGGRFFADEVWLRNNSRGGGSVFADNVTASPAIVVKDHGAAKAALFAYAVGDNKPDTNGDNQPDTGMWKHRYDVIGSIVKDYFGVQPKISASGTNAWLCLPEYRTTTNGAILMQVKNYLYDTAQANGGAGLTFTITSSLVTGKTILAYEQGRVIEKNSDGTFDITLAPDGQEMIIAYNPGTNRQEYVKIADAPALVHPFGDKTYQVLIQYDTIASSNMILKCAFQEKTDNGDGVSNEVYFSLLTNAVVGTGSNLFSFYIPDYNPSDTDYKSTPDGGKYIFTAWLESNSVRVVSATPQAVDLNWGVRPTNAVPTALTLGQTVTFPVEWENAYEILPWQNTPLSRESAFGGRVAVYRSSKTESQYSNQFAAANAVADWLESMGFEHGEPQDMMFDNVTVAGLYTDNFDDGDSLGWLRAAGCANWTVEDSQLIPANWGNPIVYDALSTISLSTAQHRVSYKIVPGAEKALSKILIYVSKNGNRTNFYSMSMFADEGGLPAATPILTQT